MKRVRACDARHFRVFGAFFALFCPRGHGTTVDCYYPTVWAGSALCVTSSLQNPLLPYASPYVFGRHTARAGSIQAKKHDFPCQNLAVEGWLLLSYCVYSIRSRCWKFSSEPSASLAFVSGLPQRRFKSRKHASKNAGFSSFFVVFASFGSNQGLLTSRS